MQSKTLLSAAAVVAVMAAAPLAWAQSSSTVGAGSSTTGNGSANTALGTRQKPWPTSGVRRR